MKETTAALQKKYRKSPGVEPLPLNLCGVHMRNRGENTDIDPNEEDVRSEGSTNRNNSITRFSVSLELEKKESEGAAPSRGSVHLQDWWSSEAMYYILPNRLYWLLGANTCWSVGEWEWYNLCYVVLGFEKHWTSEG